MALAASCFDPELFWQLDGLHGHETFVNQRLSKLTIFPFK